LSRGNLHSQSVQVPIFRRATEMGQFHPAGVLNDWQRRKRIVEESGAGSACFGCSKVTGKRPFPVLLGSTVVAKVGGIDCVLLPLANLVTKGGNDSGLDLVDGPEVEVNGGRGKGESHLKVTSGWDAKGAGNPLQHHKFT